MSQPGPCVICGDRDYPLSMGGPSLCPQCDCGNFGLARVQRLAAENERLRADKKALAFQLGQTVANLSRNEAEIERLRATGNALISAIESRFLPPRSRWREGMSDEQKQLLRLAKEMRDEADNLSPNLNVHPAPIIRRWAREISRIARALDGEKG